MIVDQSVKNNVRTYRNTKKIATGQDGEYTTCLFDYSYFEENYKLISTYLSKEELLDADLKAIKFCWQSEWNKKYNYFETKRK